MLIVLIALSLVGCVNLTKRQNQVLAVGAAVLIGGAIAARHNGGHSNEAMSQLGPRCFPQPDGSCR